MTTASALLLAHAAATLAMTGLIWFVQLVHYPLFRLADRERFIVFAAQHQRRTSWIVAPLMLTEALTASLLLFDRPDARVWSGWILLAVIWLSTWLVQIPLHRRLAQGFAAADAVRLVATNWVRTVAWTARAGLALALLQPPIGN